jgi:hypothetical protein
MILSLALSLFLMSAPLAFGQAVQPKEDPNAVSAEELHKAVQEGLREFYRSQPPLKESEIPIIIKYYLLIKSDPAATVTAMDDVAKQNKISHERLTYILPKVSYGVAIAADPKYRDEALKNVFGIEEALPTDQELEIIKKHLKELAAAMTPDEPK